MDTLQVDDFVVLGRAAPDVLKDGRKTICCAGYSKTHGFLRIYPTKDTSPLNRWNMIDVELERNPQDTRKESWKIKGSKSEWNRLDEKIKVVGKLERGEWTDLMQKLPTTTINTLNENQESLGVIEPEIIKCYCETKKVNDIQTNLFGYAVKGKKDYEHTPYVEYCCLPNCGASKPHKHQILEWGTRVYWDKHPDEDPNKVFENMRLNDPNFVKRFFVGNQHKHRKNFMVISVLRFKP